LLLCLVISGQHRGAGQVSDGKYTVIFCIAIQYQTSLNMKTKIIRDRLWLLSWVNGGRNDFMEYLRERSPDLILNLCTKGSEKKIKILVF
jgi:hypothetical protein